MSDPNIDVDINSGVDQITIDVSSYINAITVEEIAVPGIQVLEVESRPPLVDTVNNLVGDVVLTYQETLGSVSPSSGQYSYTVTHNLSFSNPMVVVYNSSNEIVSAEYSSINSNSILLKSLVDMNNYKVVVQR